MASKLSRRDRTISKAISGPEARVSCPPFAYLSKDRVDSGIFPPISRPMNSAFLRNQRRLPAADTPDLFAANPLPDGFRYNPDVLSVAEEKSLVERFEKLPLKPFEFHGYLANRRIYSLGH